MAADDGFTLIEVLVASVVLVAGLIALFGMLVVASHANQTNRVRQEATNVARELIENVRTLSYTQLATPAGIATALQPQLSPGATLSGSTLSIQRSIYSFNATFTTCSLDDPSDGYGDHSSPPASGGSWCPDVAASGTTDSNPDDYKRISVIVTPTGGGSSAHTSSVQQTVLIYARTVNGPAVSCLTTNGTCPGTNSSVTDPSVTAVTFTVTTTSPAYEIQWLVNGNPPGAQDASGANGTYTPNGTTSSFTWTLPTADGIYSISALSLDANGNSGTRSTLQITVNRHQVIAPATFNAGFDQQIHGVDVQWVPSIDQDVLYYEVYHQVGNNPPSPVAGCTQVTGTSCTDVNASAPPAPPATCTSGTQSYTTPNVYWVVGWDKDPSGNLRESTAKSQQVDANLCDHPPTAPGNLAGSFSNGVLNLSWSAPAYPGDQDPSDYIQAWRIYRWSPSQGSQPTLANRLQLVGSGNPPPFVTSASDTSPDPGGAAQDYCVTAVDTHLNESPCSTVLQR